MQLNKKILRKMIRAVQMTTAHEIGCGECFDQLERFAEMKLNGKSPEEAMPLVKDHLNRCPDCREEYEALLEALRHISSSN